MVDEMLPEDDTGPPDLAVGARQVVPPGGEAVDRPHLTVRSRK
jgi:hypothetical protein